MRDSDLYWLVGLLEGEGWFGINNRTHTLKSGEKKTYSEPSINLQMTDEDVIERAGKLIGSPVRTHQPKGNRKLLYRVSVTGKKRAIPLMELLLPHMGARRQERIKQILHNRL